MRECLRVLFSFINKIYPEKGKISRLDDPHRGSIPFSSHIISAVGRTVDDALFHRYHESGSSIMGVYLCCTALVGNTESLPVWTVDVQLYMKTPDHTGASVHIQMAPVRTRNIISFCGLNPRRCVCEVWLRLTIM